MAWDAEKQLQIHFWQLFWNILYKNVRCVHVAEVSFNLAEQKKEV